MVRKGWVWGGDWVSWRSVAWMCRSAVWAPGECSQVSSAVWAPGAQPMLSPRYPTLCCLDHFILFYMSSTTDPSSPFHQSTTWIEYQVVLGHGHLTTPQARAPRGKGHQHLPTLPHPFLGVSVDLCSPTLSLPCFFSPLPFGASLLPFFCLSFAHFI